jgi:hypothetical protein
MIDQLTKRKQNNKMEEKKENKIAALLRKPDAMEQTAVQVVPQYNLSSNKITEGKSGVATEELATRVSGVEALIPKIDIKIGKVSKKVDNLKGSTNRKFERITKEIDIIAEGIDDNNKRVTKLSALIQKNKKDSEKDSKKSEKADNKIITILTNMLDFMKLTFEQDNLARDQQNNFSEEQNAEKDRKDKELLEALKALNGRGVPTAEKIDEEGKKSFFEKILGAMASILNPLKAFMSSIGKLFTTLGKIFTSLTRFIVSAGKILLTVGRFFLTPAGIGLLAFAGAGYALYKLVDYIAKNTPNYASLGPSEASAALTSESEIKKQAATKFKTTVEKLTPEQIQQTKKELENTVTGGRKKAIDINNMAPGPEKEKAIREIGGESKLKEIIKDEKVYTIPTAAEVDTGPEKRGPRPEAGKGSYSHLKPGDMTPKLKLAQKGWDEKYGADYNPDGTKKKPAVPVPVPTPAPAPSTPSSSEEGMKGYKGRRSSPESAPVTPVPTPMSSATPMMDTPNLGTQMATMSNENALAKTVEELAVVTSSQVNNVMTATKSIVEHTTDKMPSVRNQEDTFQRMILNSTRVV